MLFRSPLLYLVIFSTVLIALDSNFKREQPIVLPDQPLLNKSNQPVLHVNWLPKPQSFVGGPKVNMFQIISLFNLTNQNIYTDSLKISKTGELYIGSEKLADHDNYNYADFGSITSNVRSDLMSSVDNNFHNNVIVDTGSWKPEYYQISSLLDVDKIFMRGISGDQILYLGHRDMRMDFERVSLRYLRINGEALSDIPPAFDMFYSPFLDPQDKRTAIQKRDSIIQVTIFNESVGIISSPYITVLKIDSCLWKDTAKIACNNTESFIFNHVKFKSGSGTGTISNSSKRPKLFLRKVDLSKFDFDYSLFKFLPFPRSSYKDQNEWYSDIVNIYQSIISSQTRLNNVEGIKSSTIEMNEFIDYNTWYSRPFIGLKIWWNNYGFDKGKVVTSSLILFLLFSIVNLLFMSCFFDNYDVIGLKEAWTNSATSKFKSFRYISLGLLYTAIIFYGIRLDFSKMETKRLDVVICLFIEYVSGLIAIAYIASLIIAK